MFKSFVIIIMIKLVYFSNTLVAEIDEQLDHDGYCLAQAMYFEARNQSLEGQIAVGLVILNRVKDSKYPDTVCLVVQQGKKKPNGGYYYGKCSFSYLCDNRKHELQDAKAWVQSKHLAYALMTEDHPDLTGGALFYHTKNILPYWASAYRQTVAIQDHVFYAR